MDSSWRRVLALAWAAYRAGSLPIGAIVLDPAGDVVAEGRSRRFETDAVPGQLAGSRLAHAEVNALAQLPSAGRYGGHALLVNVEPCCLCLGAVWQTGVGVLRFGWRDRYGGATTCMTVANPQVQRRRLQIAGPIGGPVGTITALLVASHYRSRAAAYEHVVAPWRDAEPDLFALADDEDVAAIVDEAADRDADVDELVERLTPLLRDRLSAI